MVVLDECDRLLNETFKGDLDVCLGMMPKSERGGRQTLLFTATMTDELRAQRGVERGEGRRELFFFEANVEKYVFDGGWFEGIMLTFVVDTRSPRRCSRNTFSWFRIQKKRTYTRYLISRALWRNLQSSSATAQIPPTSLCAR